MGNPNNRRSISSVDFKRIGSHSSDAATSPNNASGNSINQTTTTPNVPSAPIPGQTHNNAQGSSSRDDSADPTMLPVLNYKSYQNGTLVNAHGGPIGFFAAVLPAPFPPPNSPPKKFGLSPTSKPFVPAASPQSAKPATSAFRADSVSAAPFDLAPKYAGTGTAIPSLRPESASAAPFVPAAKQQGFQTTTPVRREEPVSSFVPVAQDEGTEQTISHLRAGSTPDPYFSRNEGNRVATPIAMVQPSNSAVTLNPMTNRIQRTYGGQGLDPQYGSTPAQYNTNYVGGTSNFQRVQALIRSMPPHHSVQSAPKPSYGSYQILQRQHHPLPPKPPVVTPPALVPYSPPKLPQVAVERKDKSLREIVITAEGITRNHTRKTTRFFPDGKTFITFSHDFDPPNYDFMEDFGNMIHDKRWEFLKNHAVEIVVDMDSFLQKVEAAEGKGKGKEKAVLKENSVQESGRTEIDTIKLVGPEFIAMIQKLTVTLAFTTPGEPHTIGDTVEPQEEPKEAGIPTGPRAYMKKTVTACQPQVDSAAFKHLEDLVKELHKFVYLRHVNINLQVPQTTQKPFTIPQLMFVLPFYDLGFTDWKLTYTPKGMSVPVEISGFSLNQVNRARNQIIAERRRRYDEMMPAHARPHFYNRKPRGGPMNGNGSNSRQ